MVAAINGTTANQKQKLIMNKYAENYYAANFPKQLRCKTRGECVTVYDDSGLCVAEVRGLQQAAFLKELCRRWNHSPQREQALMDIREMASNRKQTIRIQGMMLDSFCGQALLPVS